MARPEMTRNGWVAGVELATASEPSRGGLGSGGVALRALTPAIPELYAAFEPRRISVGLALCSTHPTPDLLLVSGGPRILLDPPYAGSPCQNSLARPNFTATPASLERIVSGRKIDHGAMSRTRQGAQPNQRP